MTFNRNEVKVLSTPGLGVGLICPMCEGEDADITNGELIFDLTIRDINSRIIDHEYSHHDPKCRYTNGMRCGYPRSVHPKTIGPEGPHEFLGIR